MNDARTNLTWGAIWLCLSVWVWWYVGRYQGIPSFDPIGPAYFPRLLALCIGMCAVGLIIEGIVGLMKQGLARRDLRESAPSLEGYLRVLKTLLACAAYVFLLEPAGYIIATPVLIAAIMLIYGERQKRRIIGMSLGFTVALWLLFALGLKVLLPPGILGLIFD